MSFTHGFDKKMTELAYNVHEGDTIRITRLDDPYDHTYVGREGVVEHIDSMGQLHGTWGGLAVIPGTDGFTVISHKEVPGKLYLFACRHTFPNGDSTRIEIFAGSEARARELGSERLGLPADEMTFNLVREATDEEYKEVELTGAPSPKRR